jgi:sugar lactone lactonase YvrE
MKVKLFSLVAFAVFFAACSKTDMSPKADELQKAEVDRLSHAVAKSKLTPAPIDFTSPFVFPEGVVYDPFNNRFLVSSIAMGTIGAVNHEGIYSPFIQDASLASTVGMEIDKARKRLLVTNTNIDGTLAQLAIYDLNTGTRLYLIDLAAVANDGALHLVNDVTIDRQGNAYVTDSYAGIIYKVDRSGNASVFYQNTDFTPAHGAFGFNGIEYSNTRQGYLLVAHTDLGQIIKIPVDKPASSTILQLSTPVVSPDGLLLSKDSKQLIVVSNTGDLPGSKVLSLISTDNWATATSAGDFSTGTVFPTTVASDGKTLWVLYSYIHLLLGGQTRETFSIQPLPFTSKHPF